MALTHIVDDVSPIVLVFQDDVNHPGYGIIAVRRAAAILKNFNAINSGQRDRVNVNESLSAIDGDRIVWIPVTVNEDQGGIGWQRFKPKRRRSRGVAVTGKGQSVLLADASRIIVQNIVNRLVCLFGDEIVGESLHRLRTFADSRNQVSGNGYLFQLTPVGLSGSVYFRALVVRLPGSVW